MCNCTPLRSLLGQEIPLILISVSLTNWAMTRQVHNIFNDQLYAMKSIRIRKLHYIHTVLAHIPQKVYLFGVGRFDNELAQAHNCSLVFYIVTFPYIAVKYRKVRMRVFPRK